MTTRTPEYTFPTTEYAFHASEGPLHTNASRNGKFSVSLIVPDGNYERDNAEGLDDVYALPIRIADGDTREGAIEKLDAFIANANRARDRLVQGGIDASGMDYYGPLDVE